VRQREGEASPPGVALSRVTWASLAVEQDSVHIQHVDVSEYRLSFRVLCLHTTVLIFVKPFSGRFLDLQGYTLRRGFYLFQRLQSFIHQNPPRAINKNTSKQICAFLPMIKPTVFMILGLMGKVTHKISMQNLDREISIMLMMPLQTQLAQTSQKLHQVNGHYLQALMNPPLPQKALEIHSVLWIMETMRASIQFPLYLGHVMLQNIFLAISSPVQGSRLPIPKRGTFQKAQALSRILPCRLTLTAMYIEEDTQIGHALLRLNLSLWHISQARMVGIPLVEMVLSKHLDFVKCNGSTFYSSSWCLAAAASCPFFYFRWGK
jgi:hypothetical protein